MTKKLENPSRVRLTPEARRAQLIEVATTLISQSGYQGLSFAALAEACGVTRAAVHHYFGSKEELLVAVLEHRDREDALALGDRTEYVDGLATGRELLDLIVARNFRQREIVRLYTVLAAEALSPEHPAHAYFAERLRGGREQFVQILRGSVNEAVADRVALQVLAFMDGLQLNWLRDPAIDFVGSWNVFADRLFGAQGNERDRAGD